MVVKELNNSYIKLFAYSARRRDSAETLRPVTLPHERGTGGAEAKGAFCAFQLNFLNDMNLSGIINRV